MSEAKIDNELAEEMEAVSNMVKRASEQGLLIEVLWSALQNNSDNIPMKCFHAVYEWDC